MGNVGLEHREYFLLITIPFGKASKEQKGPEKVLGRNKEVKTMTGPSQLKLLHPVWFSFQISIRSLVQSNYRKNLGCGIRWELPTHLQTSVEQPLSVEMVFYHKLGRFVPVSSGIILPEPLATSREFKYNRKPPGTFLLWVHLELGKPGKWLLINQREKLLGPRSLSQSKHHPVGFGTSGKCPCLCGIEYPDSVIPKSMLLDITTNSLQEKSWISPSEVIY